MSTYAIGDIQGCYAELSELLEQIAFTASSDRLWLVGDLVNRGPDSLAVLRLVKSLGSAVTVVLGNHDLYLLMVAAGFRKRGKDDTLEPVLKAPDCGELLDWLARQRLFHSEGQFAMVHAGLLPQWSIEQAALLASEVEAALRGPEQLRFLSRLPGNEPREWRQGLGGTDRLRIIVNVMTRMRFCSPAGKLEYAHKGRVEGAPPGYLPWFSVPGRASRTHTVVCGHWSALGFRREEGLLALDSGCVWGGPLTAVRLEDGEVFSCPGAGSRAKLERNT